MFVFVFVCLCLFVWLVLIDLFFQLKSSRNNTRIALTVIVNFFLIKLSINHFLIRILGFGLVFREKVSFLLKVCDHE